MNVLGALAENSKPIAYGTAAVLGLHKMMRMVMEWQNHRQALAERRSNRGIQIAGEVDAVNVVKRHMGPEVEASWPAEKTREVASAVASMERVTVSDLVDEDDPRVKGAR
ncbi:hypothetical protein HUW46_02886 [Amycolatopsis sp. CA-230715]|nr:hypothetical protein HUW46_02886 [Amycolatopsis sp. CA-230715]